MGEWILDWTLEEAEECWWELQWLWHSGGVKTNLTSENTKLHSEVTSANQAATKIVETVVRPFWGDRPQSGWVKPVHWVQKWDSVGRMRPEGGVDRLNATWTEANWLEVDD